MRQKSNFVSWFFFILLLIPLSVIHAQSYKEREDMWVRSRMEQMTLDQKIGQIFMVRAYSKGNIQEDNIITDYIKKFHIGGICFFQGTPSNQINLINKYQTMSSTPMLMGIDGEWGLAMRFPNETVSFPKQMMLGAIKDDKLLFEMGKEIGRQCKRTGININFAPSIDVNNNSKNPVIFDRSFGDSPENVAQKGHMLCKAMEEEGILSCAKHFPGHGDTEIDSHVDLPSINHDIERLERMELYPFRRLTSQGISAMMVGHLNVPSLETQANRPATLSSSIIQNFIRDGMSFNGLLITDAMDMKGVTKYFPNGVAEAEAFLAGNDIILVPENLPIAISKIKEYISSGKITTERLDQSVERILRAKFKVGLSTFSSLPTEGINNFLKRNQLVAIKQKLTEAAMTLVADHEGLVPIHETSDVHIGTLSINNIQQTKFQNRISDYVDARHYQIMPAQLATKHTQMLQTLSQFDQIIVGIHTSGKLKDFTYDISLPMISFLKELQSRKKVIFVLFGSPYLLKKMDFAHHVLLAYDNDHLTQDVAAQTLFGVNDISGTLPVTVNNMWPSGHGIDRRNIQRLGYAKPEMVSMSSDTLNKIDSIMAEVIRLQASPGGQILIAKDNKIIFQKSYGKLSQNGYYVNNNTVYDIASITKILTTTLATMKLVDDGKINIHDPLKNYIYNIDTTNKADLVIRDILAHHARLLPWIGFYQNTTLPAKSFGYNPNYYSGILQDRYTVPVAKGMFMRTDYIDTMYQSIFQTRLRDSDNYRYSDLGFYLMQKVIENKSGKSLDAYASASFYKPLGLKYTTFSPLLHHHESIIAPTENDNYFRNQTLKGHVHDMGAAMLGGVAGHAGLFSTAKEMAVLMQMLLNKGSYGGKNYISPQTIELFTTRHSRSTRRGLGFDMKELAGEKLQNTSPLAPASVFGHTGFTGTAAWADPKNNIVYIFCANRTYPGGNSQTFNKREYRIKVQTLIYKALSGYSDYIYL
ncbi:MAG: glycoside hydrolase family 3 N-terminal domain-containing protein [Saprospiraceae bacterium]